MPDRRAFLASAAVAALGPQLSWAAAAPASGETAKLNLLLNDFIAEDLRRDPEKATSLGLDTGELAWTKAAWRSSSLAAKAEAKSITAARLKQLAALDRRALSGLDAVNYDTVAYVYGVDDEGHRKFDYGSQSSGAPYVLSQLTGSYQSMPDFLDTEHSIETSEDADAYLARLSAFARVMDEELEVARHDVGLGVVPPDFVIDKTITQMSVFLDAPTNQTTLVRSIARRAKERRLKADYGAEAAKLYDASVRPALERQLAFMQALRPAAMHDAGVWRLKDGADYYGVSLRNYTTATVSPAEIHKIGLDLVAGHTAQIDAILKSQGMSHGSVGQRLRALYDDPKYRYANTDAAKDQLIADLNVKVKQVASKLPAWFGALPKAALEIRRVPKATEAGAPGGYYNSPPIDGSRPGIYWINLRDTAEVPRWVLPTLTFHEGIPGHHLQGALANEAASLPLIRKTIWFSGYGEGWALYAEQLAVEMGMYADDPIGHVGQLHDAMFRAVRLVVDSGMHDPALRWSRERAVRYAVETLGDQEPSAVTEIERYCVWPGQACSYMVGKLTWLRLRDKARAALGPRFDIRRFHDAGLLSGAMPLTVLESAIDQYVAGVNA